MVIEARALLTDEPQRERTLVTVVHKGADLVRNHCHRAQQVPAAVIDDLAVVGQIAVKRHAAEHLLLLQLEAGAAGGHIDANALLSQGADGRLCGIRAALGLQRDQRAVDIKKTARIIVFSLSVAYRQDSSSLPSCACRPIAVMGFS